MDKVFIQDLHDPLGMSEVEAAYEACRLAVTRLLPGDREKGVGWTVTHLASGMKMGAFPSKQTAWRAMQALLPLADWTAEDHAVLRGPGLPALAQQAILAAGGQLT